MLDGWLAVDTALFRLFNKAGSHALLDLLAVTASDFGTETGWAVLSGLMIVAPFFRGAAGWRTVGLVMPFALGFAWGFNELLKGLIGRQRPPFVLDNVRLIVEPHPTLAFPSGHAMVAFAGAAFVAIAVNRLRQRGEQLRPAWVGRLVLLLAVVIGWSRVYLGVHWPADVLSGAVIGSLLGWATWVSYERFVEPRITSKPPSVPR